MVPSFAITVLYWLCFRLGSILYSRGPLDEWFQSWFVDIYYILFIQLLIWLYVRKRCVCYEVKVSHAISKSRRKWLWKFCETLPTPRRYDYFCWTSMLNKNSYFIAIANMFKQLLVFCSILLLTSYSHRKMTLGTNLSKYESFAFLGLIHFCFRFQ